MLHQRKQERGAAVGVLVRLVLALALGAGMLFWPYSSRCGVELITYLGAVLAVVLSGTWVVVWTWHHHMPKTHALGMLVILWGLALGAAQALPRVGYARPDPAHPIGWRCR